MDDMIGRYINDSSKPNLKIAKVTVDIEIHLFLHSLVDIPAGSELRYNYDAPKLWWRKQVLKYCLFA